MLVAFFISSFFISLIVLVRLFRSVILDDAADQDQLVLEPFNKTEMATKSRKQGSWLTFRGVQVALGILWLLDGLLQLQHQMFSKAFVSQVIEPAAQGQPHFVSSIMSLGIHLFLLHPAIFNSLVAITQISIGIFILYKRTTKLGLLLSVLWGAVVWAFGEGFGGIFSGHTLLLMGAPGAVLLYVLLALAAWPKQAEAQKHSKKPQVAYWLAFVWLIIWVGGGVYQLLPGQNTTADLSSMIAANSTGAPSWLASVDSHTARFVNNFGLTQAKAINQPKGSMGKMIMPSSSVQTRPTNSGGSTLIVLLALIQIGIGVSVLFKGITRKLAIGLGISLALIFWVIGQSLGSYYSGTATDPNSGPLLVLLGLAILGCHSLDLQLSRINSRLKVLMIGQPEDLTQTEIVKPTNDLLT